MRADAKCLSLKDAELLMSRPGTLLVKMYDRSEGAAYFVVCSSAKGKGGRVRKDHAEQIIARFDIIEDSSGLFPGNPQSWRLRLDDD